jgi:MoaA/NifB/PqqE/SkfB family radical SAM enzyme
MANVLLTTRCNLKCPYCFAQEKLSGGQRLTMSMGDVEKVIGFLKRSKHPYFRAMGGEPTLHPEFPRILEMALENDMRVDVLSNATWPESYNEIFRRISPRRLAFLLNIDRPERYAPHIWERIERNLEAISERESITLSFNIFEINPSYEYIFELTRKYGINKLRMSLSLPVVGANNACLKLEDYKEIAPFVVEFARRAEELGVKVRMDNAVPLCMFSYEQAGELLLKGVVDFQHNMHCAPVIDIGPDLSVWCCFCLSKMWNRHLDEFKDLEEIQAFYRDAMSLYQHRLYPLDECDTCRYREQWGCQGGCLTHAVMRHGELPLEEQKAQSSGDGWKEGAVLALAPDVQISHYDMPQESYAISSKARRLEMEVDASFEPFLRALDGRCSAREVVDRYVGGNCADAMDGSGFEALAQGALRQGANELLLGMLHQGFLVECQR